MKLTTFRDKKIRMNASDVLRIPGQGHKRCGMIPQKMRRYARGKPSVGMFMYILCLLYFIIVYLSIHDHYHLSIWSFIIYVPVSVCACVCICV